MVKPKAAKRTRRSDTLKKREPATAKDRRSKAGRHPLIEVRLPGKLIARIDAWAKRNGAESRSDAIRQLVDRALAGAEELRGGPHKDASRAGQLAGRELERLNTRSAVPVEQHRRRRRLIEGPKEFRTMRKDLPKKR
jgi:Arc/MetJ-type ribon-helix-helix transcriptional regulator